VALGVTISVMVAAAVACSVPPPPPPDDFENDQPTRKPPTQQQNNTQVNAPDSSAPEAAPVCETVAPNNRCGLDPQCGCGPNETCDVTTVATGATSCVTGGGATLGRPCTQTGDCVAGLTCAYGACRPYCKTPRSKCGVAGTDLCVERLDANDKPLPNAAVCTITCDPRMPSAVCGTNNCEWFPDYYSPSKVTDCNFAGTTVAFAKCEFTSDCLPGHACFKHPQFDLECEPWCTLGKTPTECKAGFTCKDAYGASAPVIGGAKLGLCQ
jgi:hypothetical protein